MSYERGCYRALLFLHNRITDNPCDQYSYQNPACPVRSRALPRRPFRRLRPRSKCLTRRIGSPNRADRRAQLAPCRRPPDLDKIDGTAGRFIIEDPDRQPSGPPGERVEIGPALVQQRPFGEIIMAVNDVEIAEPAGEPLRITLPQQRRLALLIQGNLGIDTGVNIDAMGVDMHQPQPIEPGDVDWRDSAGIAAIRGQRGITSLGDPARHL